VDSKDKSKEENILLIQRNAETVKKKKMVKDGREYIFSYKNPSIACENRIEKILRKIKKKEETTIN